MRIEVQIDIEEFEEISIDEMMERMDTQARRVGYALRKSNGHPVGIMSQIVVAAPIISGRGPEELPASYVAMSAEIYKLGADG